jgi:hypothetical protein
LDRGDGSFSISLIVLSLSSLVVAVDGGTHSLAKWVAIDEMSSEHKDSISGALLHVLWDRRLEWVPCGERQQHNNGERLFFSTARRVFLMVDRILV